MKIIGGVILIHSISMKFSSTHLPATQRKKIWKKNNVLNKNAILVIATLSIEDIIDLTLIIINLKGKLWF